MIDPDTSQAYWDATAENYDQVFPDTLIGTLQRQAVWRQLDRTFLPGQRILELNCGTAIDALHLAERGVKILACDISPRMIDAARGRLSRSEARSRVEFRVLPTERLDTLRNEFFDGAFSNFSGLNCVKDLSAVAQNLAPMLRPGSRFLVCMVGRFYPWEIVWELAHAKPRTAFRRFHRSIPGGNADSPFEIYFHSVADVARMFAPHFRLRGRTGIGIALPPCYAERSMLRFSSVIKALAGLDFLVAAIPFLRAMGDCALLQFERVAA